MEPIETLRRIVARLAAVDAQEIQTDFSLETPALKSSIKRAVLAAAIRRELNVNCVTTHTVRTFGELAADVCGPSTQPKVESTSSLAPVPARAVSLAAAPLPTVVQPMATAGSEFQCGIDIEMVNDLPEAMDYREHEFYRNSFSPDEIAYCLLQNNPRMHFAVRWCAKEALFKCDRSFRDEKLSNIEVVRSPQGDVSLRHRVNGSFGNLPHALSLSHTDDIAAAFVVKPGAVVSPRVQVPSSASTGGNANGEISRSDNRFQVTIAIAWLLGMGVALLALLRTL
jgi:phosphopantetheine--protein transferase-like protein